MVFEEIVCTLKVFDIYGVVINRWIKSLMHLLYWFGWIKKKQFQIENMQILFNKSKKNLFLKHKINFWFHQIFFIIDIKQIYFLFYDIPILSKMGKIEYSHTLWFSNKKVHWANNMPQIIEFHNLTLIEKDRLGGHWHFYCRQYLKCVLFSESRPYYWSIKVIVRARPSTRKSQIRTKPAQLERVRLVARLTVLRLSKRRSYD